MHLPFFWNIIYHRELKFLKLRLNKLIIYYWVPRLLTCLLLLSLYKYLHLEDSGIVNPENRFSYFVDADIDKYTNNYQYNFLYSFINTNFFNGENKLYLGMVFGQLISSYSIISIFKSSEKIFKDNRLPKICLVILAIHPILVMYSLKFSTDNFMILGLSFSFV